MATEPAEHFTEDQAQKAATILRNFQRMYLDHLRERLNDKRLTGPTVDPIFTLTDGLYAAATDLIGKADE